MFLIRTMPLFLLAIFLTACSQSSSTSQSLSTWPSHALEPQTAVPLTWSDAHTLIVGNGDSIYRYDPGDGQLGQRVVESYEKTNRQNSNCFTSQGGRFVTFTSPLANNSAELSRSERELSVDVQNWSRPELQVGDSTEVRWWNTNPIDCTAFDADARKQKAASIQRDGRVVVSPRPLLAESKGEAFVTMSRRDDSAASFVLHLFSPGSIAMDRTIPLPRATNAPRNNYTTEIRSFRDSDGSYVLYEATNDFNAEHSIWPLTAWRLASNLTGVEALTLPGGPWVQPQGIFKMIGICGSCGCSCRSNFLLTGAQGHIYAHVSGQAVEDFAVGIYELTYVKGAAQWALRVPGNFDGQIVVSPNGCRIAYSNAQKRLQLVESTTCS